MQLITLALETSGRETSVALLRDEETLSTGSLAPPLRTAAGLAPLMQGQIAAADLSLRDVDLIALPVGPGSFTGLRVGVTTAKTLAYGLGCQVLGLNTLEVLAHQVPAGIKSVWAVLDAQRGQLFAGKFVAAGDKWSIDQPTKIVDFEPWLDHIGPEDHVSGAGLQRVEDRLPAHIRLVDRAHWMPQASSVGRLGVRKFAAGQRDDLWTLVPQYYRPSAAEEKRRR